MTFGLRNVMKGLTVGAIAMMISGSAFAGESLKDAPYAPSFSWTGFYVGGHAGLAVGDTEGEITGAGPIIGHLRTQNTAWMAASSVDTWATITRQASL